MTFTAGLYGLLGVGVGVVLSLAGRRLVHTHITPHDRRATLDFRRTTMWLACASGAGFAGLWLRYGPSLPTLIVSAYFSVFLLILVLDLAYRWVPNMLLIPTTVFVLIVSTLTGQPSLLNSLAGGMTGFAWFYLIATAYRGALGAGDVKLAGVIGLITGFPGVLTALTIGILTGGIVAAVLLLSGRVTRKSYIPYAPFLVAGALVSLVFGTQISEGFASISGL